MIQPYKGQPVVRYNGGSGSSNTNKQSNPYTGGKFIRITRPGKCHECGAPLNIGDLARCYHGSILYGINCHTRKPAQTQQPAKPNYHNTYGPAITSSSVPQIASPSMLQLPAPKGLLGFIKGLLSSGQ